MLVLISLRAGGLRPGEEWIPLQGRSFWESSPPMGPNENPTNRGVKQEGRRTRVARRPRMRLDSDTTAYAAFLMDRVLDTVARLGSRG